MIEEFLPTAAHRGGFSFQEAYDRLRYITRARTQVELAEVLRTRRSAISDARRRGLIPVIWLRFLLLGYRVMPRWILFGTGPQYAEAAAVQTLEGLDAILDAAEPSSPDA